MTDEMSRDELKSRCVSAEGLPLSDGCRIQRAVLRLLHDHERALALLRGLDNADLTQEERTQIAALLSEYAPEPAPENYYDANAECPACGGRATYIGVDKVERCCRCGRVEPAPASGGEAPTEKCDKCGSTRLREQSVRGLRLCQCMDCGHARNTVAPKPWNDIRAIDMPASPEPASDEDHGTPELFAHSMKHRPEIVVDEDEPPPLGSEVAALRERVEKLEKPLPVNLPALLGVTDLQKRVEALERRLDEALNLLGMESKARADLERRIGGDGTVVPPDYAALPKWSIGEGAVIAMRLNWLLADARARRGE